MKHQTCTAPDRHEPRIVCGYPMPCLHHTVIVVIGDRKRTTTNVSKKKPNRKRK